MSATYKLVNPTRFVATVKGAAEPTYMASATAATLAGRLESGDWSWEQSDIRTASMPARSAFDDYPDTAHLAYDAYSICHTHSADAGTHVGQSGMVAYRYALTSTARSLSVSGLSFQIAGCPYLPQGARVVCAFSSNSTPETTWSAVHTGTLQASGVAIRTASEDGKTWYATTETVTISQSATSAKFLYVYISLENYARSRNGYIEGAAMLVGGKVSVTMTEAISGITDGSTIDDTTDATVWTPVTFYKHYTSGSSPTLVWPQQIVLTGYTATNASMTPKDLSYPIITPAVAKSMIAYGGTWADGNRSMGNTSGTVTNAAAQIGATVSSGSLTGEAKMVLALRLMTGCAGQTYTKIRFGNAIATDSHPVSIVVNLYACYEKVYSVVAEKQACLAYPGLSTSVSHPYTFLLGGLDNFDYYDNVDPTVETGKTVADYPVTFVTKANRREALFFSPNVRYFDDDFELVYAAHCTSGYSTSGLAGERTFIEPRTDKYTHIGKIEIAEGETLSGTAVVPIEMTVPADAIATTLLAVVSTGRVSSSETSLSNVTRTVNLCGDWELA